MLLHGNEILVVYMLALFVVVGALCVRRAAVGSANRWMPAATLAAIAATFCFGSGIAAFPALALVAWISRVPLRSIGWLVAGLGFSLVVYLWLLPGSDGVRTMLDLRPIDSMATAARWIGSPWVNAWWGYADPPLYSWMSWRPGDSPIAHVLIGTANALRIGGSTNLRAYGSLLAGLAGFMVIGSIVIRHATRRAPLSSITTLALTLALFAAAISVVIGIGRLDYFVTRPEQVFADRYLPWSCMFWIGCAILVLRKLDCAGGAVRTAAILVAIAVPFALLPSEEKWAGWGEATFRNSQTSAAAALSGVYDARMFPNNEDAKTADVVRTLSILRKHSLGMFALVNADLLGTTATIVHYDAQFAVAVYGTEHFRDARTGSTSARFQAIVSSGVKWVGQYGFLAVLDEEDRICGFALPSFVGKGAYHLRIEMPRKRGFDGYIRDFSPAKSYRLVLLNTGFSSASLLAGIPSATAIQVSAEAARGPAK